MATNFSVTYTLAVTDDLATTQRLAMSRFIGGRIINRTYGGITLTVYESDEPMGTYALCSTVGTNGALAAMDEDEAFVLPTELSASAWIKFVGNVAGTVDVVLKGN